MHLRPLIRTVLAPVLVIALAVAGGLWASGDVGDTRSSLTSALDTLPADTVVAGFTDWAAIRDDLGVGASTRAARATLADDASLRDLTTRSVLGESIQDMHTLYGWSAADVDWESYGQAPTGAMMVARLGTSVSFDRVRKRLTSLGYTRRGDVWSLGAEGDAQVGPALAATLGSLVVLPRERLVLATDSPAYASRVVDTVRGSAPSLLTVRAAADVASALAGSDTVVVQASPIGCRATSLAEQEDDVVAQARAAVARVGDLARPAFTGRGLADGSPRQRITFVASFDSPTVAARQTEVRTALASGPFIGRSGLVQDSLDLVDAEARGSAAVLRFDLDPDRGAYMTGDGPLLFASCPA